MQDAAQTLQFPKILDLLSAYAKTEIGKRSALSLSSLSKDQLSHELKILDETMLAEASFGTFPIDVSSDLEKSVTLALKGGVLSAEDLEKVAHDVLTGASLLRYFNVNLKDYPLLSAFGAKLPSLGYLEKAIHRAIAPDLSIFDSASPALRRIRISISRLEKEMMSRLGFVVEANKAYLSDTTLTLRNGHYVLPVANAYKNKVRGIVQDVSGSGETTFIEPEVLVELNNRMVELKGEEHEEIRRILFALSQQVAGSSNDILTLNSMIGYLDFLQAKALYGAAIKGHVADLSPNKELYLPGARHPLLDPDKVVPNTFRLSEEKRALVLSGPNAGGKTVALKTVGLLALMFLAGLALPTLEGAELSYLNHVYTDIGDSQSIQDNLSTFSGHMSNLSSILSSAGGNDLVLLDEVGTGTSPKEGEAIAYAVIKHLLSKHCFLLASSHFEGLKAYALSEGSIENASMLFDQEKLLPTYRLQVGLPGESYGLAVAKRYGVAEDVLKEASSYLSGQQDVSIAAAVSHLSDLTLKAARLQEELDKKSADLAKEEGDLAKRQDVLKKREDSYLQDVEDKKEEMLEKAKKEIADILDSLDKPGLKPHEVIAAKKRLLDLEKKTEEVHYNTSAELGDYVSIPSYGVVGKITRKSGNKIEIQTRDGLSFQTEIDQTLPASAPAETVSPLSGAHLDSFISKGLPLEINLIGMHVDEALSAVENYLDSCRVRGYKRVRVIHGLGSGALRNAVADYLSAHPELVASFEGGGEHEGGGGATIVHLK